MPEPSADHLKSLLLRVCVRLEHQARKLDETATRMVGVANTCQASSNELRNLAQEIKAVL